MGGQPLGLKYDTCPFQSHNVQQHWVHTKSQVARHLLDAHANVDATDIHGATALHLTCASVHQLVGWTSTRVSSSEPTYPPPKVCLKIMVFRYFSTIFPLGGIWTNRSRSFNCQVFCGIFFCNWLAAVFFFDHGIWGYRKTPLIFFV